MDSVSADFSNNDAITLGNGAGDSVSAAPDPQTGSGVVADAGESEGPRPRKVVDQDEVEIGGRRTSDGYVLRVDLRPLSRGLLLRLALRGSIVRTTFGPTWKGCTRLRRGPFRAIASLV